MVLPHYDKQWFASHHLSWYTFDTTCYLILWNFQSKIECTQVWLFKYSYGFRLQPGQSARTQLLSVVIAWRALILAVHLVFDTWKRESNWSRNVSSNYLWDRYRAGQQLDIFLSLYPLTVPQVFAKNNSTHLYWVDLTGSYNLCL